MLWPLALTARTAAVLQSGTLTGSECLPPMAQQPLVGQSLLIIEASRLHPDTLLSVGLLWTSDQPDAETSTWQHTSQETDIDVHGRIRTRNPASERP